MRVATEGGDGVGPRVRRRGPATEGHEGGVILLLLFVIIRVRVAEWREFLGVGQWGKSRGSPEGLAGGTFGGRGGRGG